MNFIKISLIIAIISSSLVSSDVVKIVYNTGTPPLKFTDNNKKPNGMFIDIWKLWAKKTNTNIEFIEASWDESLNLVKNGKAHIHAGLCYTKKRDEFLDYPKHSLFDNNKYFFYHKSLGHIENIYDLQPYVVALDNGYPSLYMQENFPKISVEVFKSANSANASFFNGDYKVVLSSLPTFFYYLKKNKLDEKQFIYHENTYAYKKQYYGAVKEGNTSLLEKIDKGFDLISKDELKFIELKWTKDLDLKTTSSNVSKLTLLEEQISYLNKKEEIKMCVDPSWLPFEQIEDNKHKGMVADIIKVYESKLDFPVKLVKTSSWDETLLFAKDRKCDIISAAVSTTNRKKYLNFTKPYLKFPQVIVTREKEPFIDDFEDITHKKIGVVKNSAVVELLKNKYANINLVDVDDVADGLFKVSSGELYGFVNTTAAVSYAIAKNGMTNLKIASKADIDYYLRIAVRNDEPQLLKILNRVITVSDNERVKEIKKQWLTVKMQEVVDYTLVYKILGAFVVIVLFILYWNRKLQQEISERKAAQEKLNKYMQVIEQSQVSIMLTNKSGIIEYVNPFCVQETGYSYEEFVGSKPNILKSGFQDSQFYSNLWSTVLSGKTWSGEFSNKKKNGDIFWESAVIAPIFDEDKNIKYFASIKEDVTEKVKVQKELLIAQKEAESANRAKSDFLAKMSHEIRTPMNAVLGMLYLLEKTNLNTTQENYIKKAHGAANSLLGVINDILDFSKIEANKMEIKNSEFDIHLLINDIMSVMSVKAEESDLELLTYYDKTFPVNVISDPLRVSQILNNLLSNAIKFTNQGEILVSTKLVNQNDDEALLMFCVRDTGIGISKENQNKLFQEFSQVDDSATRSFNGTGLGLAISKKLANLLGGDIWLEDSKEGVGTTICFTIKVKIIKDHLYKDFNFPMTMTNLSVLIVDDNPTACHVLKEMLESFDYGVDVVNSGMEAISIVQKFEYDLVFLDYKMPGLNGVETYLQYKGLLEDKTPKTLIVTAYSQEIIEEDVEKYGILGYLTKPISPSTLYDSIINTLNTNIKLPEYRSKKTNNEYLCKAKVLLVEDNQLNQEFAVTMLEAFGLEVDVANDGLEAIEKIETKEYKLVLMDIQMPKLDGLEATKRIRQKDDEYFKNIPIIALSANALVGDKEKSIEAGMNEHITKPINPQKLYDTLKIYINEVQEIDEVDAKEFEFISSLDKSILDINEAMSRMSNNEKAYMKILEQFNTHYADVFTIIEELISKKDIDALDKKTHELKGIAGNIAAIELFKDLSSLNSLLSREKMPSFDMFESMNKNLINVITEIEKIDIKSFVEEKEFNSQVVTELLFDMKNNLTADIVKCEENLEKLKPYLQKEHEEFAFALSKSLSEFDMDRVDELIEAFLKDMNNEE